MIIVSSVASFATLALAASMSFSAHVMPVGTGAPSHVERDVRVVNQRASGAESARGHASAAEARNAGTPSVASNLRGDRDGDLRNIPVGGMVRHREGMPSMTDSREGEVSTFR